MTNLFKVEGQTLTPVEIYPAVSDTVNYLTFAFMFSYDWDVLVKSAIFTKGASEYEVVLVNDAITADRHVNLSAGDWTLSVVGSTVVDAVVTKQITTTPYTFTVSQSDAVDGEEFPPSVASQVYVNINQSTPQTFIDGVPKLAADRAIDSDNEITDKKYVDDKVATVIADDFNHNDLSNKQGGTAGEYYHTTQAQNAALHAHSNKTALDAVSGTNTGDQDAAGVANTPAGNIAAVTVQAAINELDAEKEAVVNKVTSISEASIDTQYPSAKCTYDAISAHNTDAGAHFGMFDVFSSKNLHDYTDDTDGYYVPYTSGVPTALANFSHSDYISITAGESYVISRKNRADIGSIHVAFYNASKVFMSGVLASAVSPSFVAPAGSAYLIFSVATANKTTYQIEHGSTATMFMPYLVSENKKFSQQYVSPVELTYDGSITLRALLEGITNATEDNPYIVYLPEGTYDTLSYYSAEEIAGASFAGLFVPDNVTLCGIGDKSATVLTASLDVVSTTISTINLAGTAHLKNLTVNGTKMRYPVHDDYAHYSIYNKHYYRNVENCVFNAVNCGFGSAYGSGTRSGAIWKFKDCEFNSNGNAFGIHSNVTFDVPNDITFENCRFNGSSASGAVIVKSLGSGVVNRAHFIGCDIPDMLINEGSSGLGIDWEIDGHGNNEVLYTVTTTAAQNVVCRFREEVKTLNATGTLAKGDIVFKNAYNAGKMSAATAVRKFAGVAMDGASTGAWVPVKRKGYIIKSELPTLSSAVNGDSITITSGLLAVSASTTDYIVGVIETQRSTLFLHLL